MGQRVTAINLEDSYIIVSGEPILDTKEGVLIIAFEDGTSRVFNWDYVIDFYYMTEEESAVVINGEDGK
jgi:hypothetical protein